MEFKFSLMECHLSLVELDVEEGLLVIKRTLRTSHVVHRLLGQRLAVGLVDRDSGRCVRANLLDMDVSPAMKRVKLNNKVATDFYNIL